LVRVRCCRITSTSGCWNEDDEQDDEVSKLEQSLIPLTERKARERMCEGGSSFFFFSRFHHLYQVVLMNHYLFYLEGATQLSHTLLQSII